MSQFNLSQSSMDSIIRTDFNNQIAVQSHAFNKNVTSVDMQRENGEFKTRGPL